MQPFAYQSREYLREATIGKIIQFSTLYTVPTGTKREYGTISIRSGLEFPTSSVEAGWVKIRDDAGRKDDSEQSKEFLDDLKQKESAAKSGSKGIWTSGGGKLEAAYEIPDPQAFVERYKGKPLKAVVERVLAGDRMLVRFLLSSTKHVQTLVMVAGIKAPSTSRTPAEGKPIPAEPFGQESHHFVESRMLHRLVEVDVLGLTPQNVLVCEVKHPNGSIAKFIVEAGLARCIDFHSTMLGPRMGDLRKAENRAKNERLGFHKGHVEEAKLGASEMDATVTRVHNADTIYIKSRSGDERRVSISSIRQPKPKDPQQAPFSADAKEFLRKKLIGKHVKVTVDGRKAASEGFEEHDAVTIIVNNKNVALQLVEAGYASAVRHGKDSSKHLLDSSIFKTLKVLQRTEAQYGMRYLPLKQQHKQKKEACGPRHRQPQRCIKTTPRVCKKPRFKRPSSSAKKRFQESSTSLRAVLALPFSCPARMQNSPW